ncbi:MAG: UbiD family decarboxylase [Promethearchaeota archaeon]
MDLRTFLTEQETNEHLIQITKPVSLKYELSALLNKLDNGPTILFENTDTNQMKIVGNTCASRQSLCMALQKDKKSLHDTIINAMNSPRTPKKISFSSLQDRMQYAPDLTRLPIPTFYEKDRGPYLTASLVFAKSPTSGIQNASFHRMLVIDKTHLAIRLVPRTLYKFHQLAKELKQSLPIAIAIGLHPAVHIGASTPLPYEFDEMSVANTLMNDTLTVVPTPSLQIDVPSHAEIILEGYIHQEETIEGPFTDITGTYDEKRSQPIVEITNMVFRKDTLFQTILPGGMEHKLLMGFPKEAKIYEYAKNVVPDVHAVNLSAGGSGWLHAIISLTKQKQGDAKNAIFAAFAAHPSLKICTVVDEDIDVYDINDVEWAICTRVQADEDIFILPKCRGSSLDPSGDQQALLTTKMGVDATRDLMKPKELFEKAKIPGEDEIDPSRYL